jgi:ferric-dicitrate binding protein FerR (iron transport regulator)
VELARGEAYFDIAHDARRPMSMVKAVPSTCVRDVPA